MELLAEAGHEMAPAQSSPLVMILFGLGMLITFIGVAHERFHKTVAALLGGGLLCLAALKLDYLGFEKPLIVYDDIYEFLKHDLNVFGVIVGTGILVDVTGKSGLFHFLSMWIVRVTGGQAVKLYLAICLLTFLFVAVLTIVPAMLILASLVLVICRSLDYDPKPFLLSVAICANSGAIVTFASGLPNIMIGTSARIPYSHFLMVSAPFAAISLLIALGMLRFYFREALPWKQSPEECERLKARMSEYDPWALVQDRQVLLRSALILLGTVLGFAFAQVLGLGMDFIAMMGATAALLFAGKSVEETIAKVNWTVILFFMGLFLIIGCVSKTGALVWLAEQVVAIAGQNILAFVPLLSFFSAIASAIVDNIPVAATLIPIVKTISATGVPAEPLWWSLVLGCNLGGNGTPIGSISCVIALYTLKKEAHQEVGWAEFIKIGGAIMMVQMVFATLYLIVLYEWELLPKL